MLQSLNKHRKEYKFQVNDIVFMRTKPISNNSAVQAKHDGPHIILETSKCTALLQPLNKSEKAKKAHFAQLISCKQFPVPISSQVDMLTHFKKLL
jgi:hypothetical protein